MEADTLVSAFERQKDVFFGQAIRAQVFILAKTANLAKVGLLLSDPPDQLRQHLPGTVGQVTFRVLFQGCPARQLPGKNNYDSSMSLPVGTRLQFRKGLSLRQLSGENNYDSSMLLPVGKRLQFRKGCSLRQLPDKIFRYFARQF
jgi:hypothetical protein